MQCYVKDAITTATYIEKTGLCKMVQAGATPTDLTNEGVVFDEGSCLALCERSQPKCVAYEFSSTKNCKTFYGLTGIYTGDDSANNKCYIRPRTLIFDAQVGKCERVDKTTILDTQITAETGTFADAAAC